MDILLTGVYKVLIGALLSILGLGATYLIGIAGLYLTKKRQALITKTGIDKYNADLTIAKAIYFQVEQLFKFIPGAGTLKADMFDKLILDKVPGLTQDEIDHFRESIVGEVNSQLTTILAPAFNPLKDEADVVNLPITNISSSATTTTATL